MITVSLCMIVKNEAKILARCLDSVADLVDEVIIVDTGSTDATRDIAAHYTDNIYDFAWIDDFSAARNFAFSKARGEYIYSADADEVLSPENRERFRALKQTLLPEIEIVQMKYGNQLQNGSVYNFDEEYRPKLFKRLREFVWVEPIHETVRLQPVVYDSDIVITHMQEESHAGRDLRNFEKQIGEGRILSSRLFHMYARELYLAGTREHLEKALPYLKAVAADSSAEPDVMTEACCVLTKAGRELGQDRLFYKYSAKLLAGEGCSEVCTQMGLFYEDAEDYEEAAIWYYNAVYETTPCISLQAAEAEPLTGLIRCYEKLGIPEQAAIYRQEYTKRERKTDEVGR